MPVDGFLDDTDFVESRMGSEATEQYSLKSNKVVPAAPRVDAIDIRCNGHHILIICVEARCLGHENSVRLLRRGSGSGRANIARIDKVMPRPNAIGFSSIGFKETLACDYVFGVFDKRVDDNRLRLDVGKCRG